MLTLHQFTADDGVTLGYATLGAGPVVILVHGFLSNGATNWIGPGTAQALADAGFCAIMPDLRGHGHSERPIDPSAYPPDVLPADVEALIRHLELPAYDLVGYSLGARTAARVVVRGRVPAPRRLVLGGMGLTGLLGSMDRRDWFAQAIRRRDRTDLPMAERTVVRFLKSAGADPEAAIHVLHTQVDSTLADLAAITMPTLILAGRQDQDNGSAADLAAAIPTATLVETPGSHMSAVVEPAFRQAIVDSLGA